MTHTVQVPHPRVLELCKFVVVSLRRWKCARDPSQNPSLNGCWSLDNNVNPLSNGIALKNYAAGTLFLVLIFYEPRRGFCSLGFHLSHRQHQPLPKFNADFLKKHHAVATTASPAAELFSQCIWLEPSTTNILQLVPMWNILMSGSGTDPEICTGAVEHRTVASESLAFSVLLSSTLPDILAS